MRTHAEYQSISSTTNEAGSAVDPETKTDKVTHKEKRKMIGWSSLSYTTRVTLAFAFIAAMTALVAIGVVSFVWEQHFQTYTSDNMETLANATAESIAANCKAELKNRYPDEVIQEGEEKVTQTSPIPFAEISTSELNDVLRSSLQDPVRAALLTTSGIGIQVSNNPERRNETSVLFDSSYPANEAISKEAGKTLAPLTGRSANANITVEDKIIGSVRIWVYGSETLMRQPDQEFRNNSYQALLFATVAAILLASCIGFLFARNLVAPINRMTKTASAIKEGDLSARTGLQGEDEIARLGETFDEMAESVEKDRELERRLTTDVAHELRTPLMAIQSTVEAMVDGVFDADEERLETVNSEVQRLSRLVDALLKLSRLENRGNPMKEEVVDVGDLIASIVATHEAFVIDSGLTLKYIAEKDVRVLGDADMIRQATANLISNAVRYTPEGGTITVQVKKGDLMASIIVQDTGIGLTPEEAKMVFSRFWRADAGRNRESGGLGVGLAVVKEIVDRHGGWVQVEGKKDEGARFTIHLPLYDDSRSHTKDRNTKQQHKQQQRQQKQGSGRSGKIG